MLLLSIDWTNLHELLRSLYDEMMPLCEDMASVAKGVAGLGALFYVAYRVWQSLSRGFFPPYAKLLPPWSNSRPST